MVTWNWLSAKSNGYIAKLDQNKNCEGIALTFWQRLIGTRDKMAPGMIRAGSRLVLRTS